jgi:hypothetical protein
MVALTPAGRVEILDGPVPRLDAGRGAAEEKEDLIIDARIEALARMLWSSETLRPARPLTPVELRHAGEQARANLRSSPPPGSHWAAMSGCGFEHVEGLTSPDDEKVGIDCGMGMIPTRSARFLYFWTRTPEQRYLDKTGRKV